MIREEWPGVPLRTQSLKREYRRLVDAEDESAFSLASSCLSCRKLLLSRASRYMERIGASYLVTGDVVGVNGVQRSDLTDLAEAGGLSGRVLRPLCMENPTMPRGGLAGWTETGSWRRRRADNSSLLKELAERVGIECDDPMTCQSRCKLMLPGFGDRVAHLFHETSFTLNELRLLDFPWYYEIRPETKVVVAIDEQEKRELQNLFLPQDLRVYPASPHGPMTLVRMPDHAPASFDRAAVIELAARITTAHLENETSSVVPVYYRFEDENERYLMNVTPFASHAEVERLDAVHVVPLQTPLVGVS